VIRLGDMGRFPLFGRKKKEVVKMSFPTALFEALKARPNLLMNNFDD